MIDAVNRTADLSTGNRLNGRLSIEFARLKAAKGSPDALAKPHLTSFPPLGSGKWLASKQAWNGAA
jgi:hypothetical protein